MSNIRRGPATFNFQLKFNYIISLTGENTFIEYSVNDKIILISTDLSHNLRHRNQTSNETLDSKELETKIDEIKFIESSDHKKILEEFGIISKKVQIKECSFFLRIKIINVHEFKIMPILNEMNQLVFEKI